MAKGKIEIPFREGKPTSCIVCGAELHRKSEYYCSKNCEGNYPHKQSDKEKPPFLSNDTIQLGQLDRLHIQNMENHA